MREPNAINDTAACKDAQDRRDHVPSVEGVPVDGQESYRIDDMPEDLVTEFEAALRTATYGA